MTRGCLLDASERGGGKPARIVPSARACAPSERLQPVSKSRDGVHDMREKGKKTQGVPGERRSVR